MNDEALRELERQADHDEVARSRLASLRGRIGGDGRLPIPVDILLIPKIGFQPIKHPGWILQFLEVKGDVKAIVLNEHGDIKIRSLNAVKVPGWFMAP